MGTSIISQWFFSKAACSLYGKEKKLLKEKLTMEEGGHFICAWREVGKCVRGCFRATMENCAFQPSLEVKEVRHPCPQVYCLLPKTPFLRKFEIMEACCFAGLISIMLRFFKLISFCRRAVLWKLWSRCLEAWVWKFWFCSKADYVTEGKSLCPEFCCAPLSK